MSLLDAFARSCVLLKKIAVPDGMGGELASWADGASFECSLALDNCMEARRAEKEGVTSLYTALVDKDMPISYGDYFRDTASGETYRVTSNPKEKVAPATSGLSLKVFTAERKETPL